MLVYDLTFLRFTSFIYICYIYKCLMGNLHLILRDRLLNTPKQCYCVFSSPSWLESRLKDYFRFVDKEMQFIVWPD